jgi:hypothetical protein
MRMTGPQGSNFRGDSARKSRCFASLIYESARQLSGAKLWRLLISESAVSFCGPRFSAFFPKQGA